MTPSVLNRQYFHKRIFLAPGFVTRLIFDSIQLKYRPTDGAMHAAASPATVAIGGGGHRTVIDDGRLSAYGAATAL